MVGGVLPGKQSRGIDTRRRMGQFFYFVSFLNRSFDSVVGMIPSIGNPIF